MILNVTCIFGTRPEAIKMAPVVAALKRAPAIRTTVVVTGQHREMLDQVLNLFGIRPDIDLDVMRPNQTLSGLSALVLSRLDPVLEALQREKRSDVVLVHGDTPTAFLAGLSAYYRRIPVGHVEAGLWTYDIDNTFQDEVTWLLLVILSR